MVPGDRGSDKFKSLAARVRGDRKEGGTKGRLGYWRWDHAANVLKAREATRYQSQWVQGRRRAAGTWAPRVPAPVLIQDDPKKETLLSVPN